ncbi:MAG: dipicolinate synthase subunit DpsA, partial [Clostridia bacterium]|nr:dipicolinate synthase subunit DpsA [Clostridia bacterium]
YDIGRAVRCADWKSAVGKSIAVILPLPISRDGINLNAPFGAEKLEINAVIEALSEGTLLFCGKVGSNTKSVAKAHKIRVIDYNDCEEFQVKNAVPSAEGAVEIAMRETDKTLSDSRIFILGFGRIGKALLSILRGFSSDVTVAARKASDRALAKIFGAENVQFFDEKFLLSIADCDIIFNTVPTLVLSRKILEKLRENCIIIDLASGEGGTDFSAAESLGIKAIHALALPGKVAPVSAGEIICDTVISLLNEERGDIKI